MKGVKGVVELFGADVGLERKKLDELRQEQIPSDMQDVQEQARRYYQTSELLGWIVRLNAAFGNYRLQLKPAEGGSEAAWKSWQKTNQLAIHSFVRQAWIDWELLDAVVAFWWDPALAPGLVRPRVPVYTLKPERCLYTDALGLERLEYEHQLTSQQIAKLPEALRQRYSRPRVELSEEYGEHYQVLKRAPVGDGFGCPRVYAAFSTLGQAESMAAGDYALGYAARTLVRQHKLGHEIKNGQRAGLPTHFYKHKRGEEIRKYFEGRLGICEITTNFDHAIDYVALDPKLFDASKWDNPQKRLVWWGGPAAALVFGGGDPLQLMTALRVVMTEEREQMAPFLAQVISEVFAPPGPLEITWSDRCFADPRTAAELLKFSVTQGATSLETLNEQAGNNHAQEAQRKRAEAEDPETWMPLFDAAHGASAEGQEGEGAARKAPSSGRRATEAKRRARSTEDPGGRPEGT